MPFAINNPTPDEIRAARALAMLTQPEAAALCMLSGGSRWSEYESGARTLDGVRWQWFLLVTNQHPQFRLTRRRGEKKPAR